MTKRERYIATAAGGLVALVLVNGVFVSPLLARKDDLDTKLTSARADLSDAEDLLDKRPRQAKRWSTEMAPALKRTGPDAESQIINSISNWAKEAGMTVLSVKPDRPLPEKEFARTTVHLTGSGTMSQIGYFLYRVQMSQIPVRVNDLTLGTRKEATDDLAVSLNLSTILFTADGSSGSAAGRGQASPAAATTGSTAAAAAATATTKEAAK
jgi:hypothetical protein